MSKVVSHLKVLDNASELVYDDGSSIVFLEGKPSKAAVLRMQKIKDEFSKGFLDRSLVNSQTLKGSVHLTPDIKRSCDDLVDSVTQNLGRAIMGISILQMAIKAIEPNQSIRLHKGGSGDFSWVDGISMRTLDSNFLTPFLRANSLLSINADGVFMTRGLAENYPYSIVYKAALKGPKKSWLEVVEFLEQFPDKAEDMLLYSLSKLQSRANNFQNVVSDTEKSVTVWVDSIPDMSQTESLIERFLQEAPNSARLLEICIHSMIFTLGEDYLCNLKLKPMAQMRSANKKAGNIGDIELVTNEDPELIIEAWDAKYGLHQYIDELDFLREKLDPHPECKRAGFITDQSYSPDPEVDKKIQKIKSDFDVDVVIMNLMEWCKHVIDKAGADENEIAPRWVENIHSYLSLKLIDIAPIDEPTENWLKILQEVTS
jgi:hypothetical protein